MKIVFYKSINQRNYVGDFIERHNEIDIARIGACLKSIEQLGFDSPRVEFRQIRGHLWEIKIRTIDSGIRIFYVCLEKEVMMLLHAYKKQSQKTPLREIRIAEKRMLEVLEYGKSYA